LSITKVFKHVDSSIPTQLWIGCLSNIQQPISPRNTSSLLMQDNNLSADHGFYQGLFQSITNVPKGWFSSQAHLAEPNLEPINDHVFRLKSILIKHQYRLYNPIEAQDYFVVFLVAITKYEFSTSVGLDT
jgi:hypothetical protein